LKERWAAFLFFTDDGRYRLYHASLRDFLSGDIPKEQPLTPADRHLVNDIAERTRRAHRKIAEYYRREVGGDWTRLATANGGYGLRHLVAHLATAGEWDALYALLTDFDFLEARCRATTVFDLEADYRLALAAWPREDIERQRVLAAFEDRLRLEASCLPRTLAGSSRPSITTCAGWTPRAALCTVCASRLLPAERVICAPA
jgi:hypothetical protein